MLGRDKRQAKPHPIKKANGEDSVSVAMEEIEPSDWAEKVYRPEVKSNLDTLKKPAYDENEL